MSYDIHDRIMRASNIEGRIAGLQSIPFNFARDLDDDEEAELTELRAFRELVTDEYGRDRWLKLTFLADHYQAEYAAQMAEEIYGEATNENAWNDEVWEEDYYGTDRNPGAKSFTLEDTEYWTDGQR